MQFSLVLDRPARGIHVYAPSVTGYKPIALSVQPQPGLLTRGTLYPPSEDYRFKPLNEHVQVYQRPFRIVQDVLIDASPQRAELSLRLPPILARRFRCPSRTVNSCPTIASYPPLAREGWCEVYLAEDVRLGRKLALKIVSARLAQNEDRLLSVGSAQHLGAQPSQRHHDL